MGTGDGHLRGQVGATTSLWFLPGCGRFGGPGPEGGLGKDRALAIGSSLLPWGTVSPEEGRFVAVHKNSTKPAQKAAQAASVQS